MYLEEIVLTQMQMVVFFMSVLILFICILYVLNTKARKKEEKYKEKIICLQTYMKNQEKYIEKQIEQGEKLIRFRHDVCLHLNVINKFIEEEKYQNAINYIDDINNNVFETDIKKYTGINVIDAIINEKAMYMKKKNIDFEWEGQLYSIILDKINIYELCIIFSNILDNGIEACQMLKEGRKISMCVEMIHNKMFIKEKNKKSGEIVFDDKGNPQTTKADKKNHGIGGRNIRSAVEKYGGILKYEVTEDFFCIQIII